MQNTNFQNLDLERELDTAISDIQAKARIDAEENSALGLPLGEGDNLAQYAEPIHLGSQSLIERISQVLQSESTRYKAFNAEANFKERMRELSAKKAECLTKFEQIKKKWNAHPMRGRRRENHAWSIIAVLNLFEGLLAQPIFAMLLGLGYLLSLLTGVIFGCILGLFYAYSPDIIRNAQTKTGKKIRIFFLSVLLALLFLYLGDLRADYLNAESGYEEGKGPYTIWSFFFLSTIIAVVSISMVWRAYKTTEEAESIRELEAIEQEKINCKNELADIEQQKIRLREETDQIKFECSQIITYGAHLEKEVVSRAHLCLNTYKQVNMRHRKDRPSCFNDDYPFEFTLHFQILNS